MANENGNGNGGLGKSTPVQLGLVVVLLSVAIGGAFWASRIETLVERLVDDTSEVLSIVRSHESRITKLEQGK